MLKTRNVQNVRFPAFVRQTITTNFQKRKATLMNKQLKRIKDLVSKLDGTNPRKEYSDFRSNARGDFATSISIRTGKDGFFS